MQVLKQLSFSISYCREGKFSMDEGKTLAKWIGNLKALQAFQIEDYGAVFLCDNECVSILTEHMTKLEEVYISFLGSAWKDNYGVLRSITEKSPNLETLGLYNCHPVKITEVAVTRRQKLTHLMLQYDRISGVELINIGNFKNLRNLELTRITIDVLDDAKVKDSIKSILTGCSSLKCLSLNQIRLLGVSAMHLFLEAIANYSNSLVTLKVGCSITGWYDDDEEAIMKEIQSNLKSILKGCNSLKQLVYGPCNEDIIKELIDDLSSEEYSKLGKENFCI